MKHSELRRALEEEFGSSFAGVVVRDHWLVELGGTAEQALALGVDARAVWLAICSEFQIPAQRRHGRGLLNPER